MSSAIPTEIFDSPSAYPTQTLSPNFPPMSETLIEHKFSEFHSKWMDQTQEFLQFLVMAYRNHSPVDYPAMAEKLAAHHKDYYSFKWPAAREDVLAFFRPVWLSPLENAYQWMTGWKPSVAFRLVKTVAGLTEEQGLRMEALRVRIKAEEERVEREMERQQVGMADRKVVETVKNGGGDATAVVAGLERVMRMADCVRMKTVKGVLDGLSPVQGVVFMASLDLVLVRLRKLGETKGL